MKVGHFHLLLNGNSGQLRTAIQTPEKTVKLQAIRRLCNRLPDDIRAVFATKSLLELGCDECDNLNFVNFKN